MTSMHMPGTELLTAADLESIVAGNAVPGWWYLFLYGVSESQSFVDGFRAGYTAG